MDLGINVARHDIGDLISDLGVDSVVDSIVYCCNECRSSLYIGVDPGVYHRADNSRPLDTGVDLDI